MLIKQQTKYRKPYLELYVIVSIITKTDFTRAVYIRFYTTITFSIGLHLIKGFVRAAPGRGASDTQTCSLVSCRRATNAAIR